MNVQTNACDPQRLEAFLSGQLSDAQQREVISHLNTCENCRRLLAQQAAEPQAWMEAEKLLKPSQFDWRTADEVSGSAVVERSTREPQIQAVLDALGPTDDPQTLGRLGGYEVSGVVGAGGMGVVLKAIDKSLDRTVAIKVLAPHLAASGAARKRFAREAKAAAAVLHPNVIAIHSVSNDEALPYLVMPYLRGQSLQKRLDADGPLSLQEILRIGSQIAAGLAAAHAQGLVHRDIKPANILLEEGVERVAITDFGLARAIDDATITHSGMIAGTPQYMSPQQARGEPVDPRSDLFSLGSVLYAICTGRPPFRAETTYGVIRRITDDEPTSIRQINPDIPDWLCTIIARLMSKRPEDRFESAQEVAELLETCLAHVQQPAAVALPAFLVAQSHGGRLFSLSRRRLGVIAMIAACGFGLFGMILWLSADPPDISGRWTGEDWGQVVLEKREGGAYDGTYTDTFGKEAGKLELKWSAMEHRFKGTWREGQDRSGKIALRLVDHEIRGAWTTDKESRIQPGTPELADLLWKRSGDKTAKPRTTQHSVAGKTQPAEPQPKAATAMPNRLNYFTTGHSIKIACSADGKRIVVANGNPTRILQVGGTSRVKGNWKPTADILDVETEKVVVSLKLTTADEDAVLAATQRISHIEVTALAFSPAGNVVAVGTSVGQVKLYSARTGELVRALDDEPAKLADKKAPENWRSLRRAMGSVASLAFSPDGSLLAMCGGSFDDFPGVLDGVERLTRKTTGPGRLKVWDVKAGTLKHDLVGHSYANTVAFSPDGNLLASAGSWLSSGGHDHGAGVIIWNPQTGAKIRTITSETNGGTHAVAFSPNSKMVVFGSEVYDKENDSGATTVSLTYALSGITQWQHQVPGGAKPKAFSPDGKSVLVLSGQSIQFLDAETGTVKREIKSTDLSKDGRWGDFALPSQAPLLVIGTVDEEEGNVEVWDLGPGPAANSQSPPKATDALPKRLHEFPTGDRVTTIAYSADGKLIAVASGNTSSPMAADWKRTVEILDAGLVAGKTVVSLQLTTKEEDAVLAATQRLPRFEVQALAFSPDGSVLAVGTSIGQVKLFNSRTGELIRSLDDEQPRLADKETPENWKPMKRAMGSVTSLAFSHDGSLLATCGSTFREFSDMFDGILRETLPVTGPSRLKVWEVKTGTLKHDLIGHSQAEAVSFSADGDLLASAGRWAGSDHGSGVIIWDPGTGKKIRTILIEANGGTHAVAFSPTRKMVVIGSRNFDKEKDTSTTTISVAYALSGITEWKQTIPGYANPKAFLPDGKSIAVLCGGQSIRFIDAETGTVKHEIKSADFLPATPRQGSQWNDFAITPTGPRLAIVGVDKERKGSVEVWDLGSPGSADNPAPGKSGKNQDGQ